MTTQENPSSMRHSRFWKLVPSSGQQFEPNHENWLVIDLSDEIYQRPTVQRVGTVEEKIKMGVDEKIKMSTSDLDARLKKIEEKMGNNGVPEPAESTSTTKEIRRESKIKSKLAILHEMIGEGIISEEDYDYKKAKLLREAMIDMSVKDQLREIKELKSEGLITEANYNEKKKELLDQF